jgi:hypothetical protein
MKKGRKEKSKNEKEKKIKLANKKPKFPSSNKNKIN